jgi:hypothetical protein
MPNPWLLAQLRHIPITPTLYSSTILDSGFFVALFVDRRHIDP